MKHLRCFPHTKMNCAVSFLARLAYPGRRIVLGVRALLSCAQLSARHFQARQHHSLLSSAYLSWFVLYFKWHVRWCPCMRPSSEIHPDHPLQGAASSTTQATFLHTAVGRVLTAFAGVILIIAVFRFASRIFTFRSSAVASGAAARLPSRPNKHPASGRPSNRPGSSSVSAGAAAAAVAAPLATRSALSSSNLKGTQQRKPAERSFDDQLYIPPPGSDTEGTPAQSAGVAAVAPKREVMAKSALETLSVGKGSKDTIANASFKNAPAANLAVGGAVADSARAAGAQSRKDHTRGGKDAPLGSKGLNTSSEASRNMPSGGRLASAGAGQRCGSLLSRLPQVRLGLEAWVVWPRLTDPTWGEEGHSQLWDSSGMLLTALPQGWQLQHLLPRRLAHAWQAQPLRPRMLAQV
jgi:hypothetical protein